MSMRSGAMLYISTAYAVVRCPSAYSFVRPFVTFAHSVKTNVSSVLSPLGSHTILVFPHQTLWRHSDGDGGVEWRWGMKKSIFWTHLAPSRVINCVTVRCYQQSAAWPWQYGPHRWSLCTALEWSRRALPYYYRHCCHTMLCHRWKCSYNEIA